MRVRREVGSHCRVASGSGVVTTRKSRSRRAARAARADAGRPRRAPGRDARLPLWDLDTPTVTSSWLSHQILMRHACPLSLGMSSGTSTRRRAARATATPTTFRSTSWCARDGRSVCDSDGSEWWRRRGPIRTCHILLITNTHPYRRSIRRAGASPSSGAPPPPRRAATTPSFSSSSSSTAAPGRNGCCFVVAKKRRREEEKERRRDEETKRRRDEETKRLRDEETKRRRDEEKKRRREEEKKRRRETMTHSS